MGIRIIKAGLLTTVQDAGRRGYQRYGMAVCGALDVHAYTYANILVGNDQEEAVLECTMLGPTIEFTTPCVIALTGGDLSPALNDKPAEMYRALQVQSGDVLSFGELKSGCRAYIAFAGGLDVPPVMGSRSTNLKASLGGLDGRKLQDGDEIAFCREGVVPKNLEKRAIEPMSFSGEYMVHVLMGPQDDRFTEAGIHTFLNSTYTVSTRFDRMGCRLQGPIIEHVTDGNIITDGIAFGAIQVPSDGEPIIMLADRQTTGGYTKIASVINVDMPMITQCKAGDTVRFERTDIRTAQNLFVAQKERFRAMRAELDGEEKPVSAAVLPQAVFAPDKPIRRFNFTINGKAFDVQVQETN